MIWEADSSKVETLRKPEDHFMLELFFWKLLMLSALEKNPFKEDLIFFSKFLLPVLVPVKHNVYVYQLF